MYRSYENPRELEKRYQEELARVNQPDYVMDSHDIETLEDLRERINFAWQDDEYNQMCEEVDLITGGVFG